VPRLQLMRRSTAKDVLHLVDVETAHAEPRAGAAGAAAAMAAHENVGAAKDTGFLHDRLRRRSNFFGWGAEDLHPPRHALLGHEVHHGACGGDRDGRLRVMLVAVEGALRAAEGIVLADEAERWSVRSRRRIPRRHERGLESGDVDIDGEPCRTQDFRERVNRLELLESDLGVVPDPVAQRLHASLPVRVRALKQTIAISIRSTGQALARSCWGELRLET